MTTITLAATHTSETIPADRLAIGVPAFERRYQRAFGAVAIPSELHVTMGQPDSDELDAFDDELRAHAVTVETLVASGRGYVLLPGSGVDGCDVWALATITD
jgi:hypothetical protein